MDWIKTDDFQYCRKIEENKYKIIEANYCDGKYAINEGKIINLKDWIRDGSYTKECASIISSYYSDIKEFENSCGDIDARKQILAEMIYESTSCLYYDYPLVSEDDAEKILEHYIETGEYLDI